jgi:hypothetical protein
MGTRLTLTSRVREYIDETDEDNSHFTDVQIYSFLNQAIRFLGTDLEWPLQTAEASAIEDQAVYTLPEDFISLADVYFDSDPLVVIERADLPSLRSDWQNQDSGRPRYAYKSDNQKFGVWPPPSADNTSDDEVIQIQYIKLPADLSDDVTAPDLHTAFQDCLPFYAAFICEKSMGNLKAAQNNLDLYNYHKKALLTKLQRFSDGLLRFRW